MNITDKLQFCPIKLLTDYAEKWNERGKGFGILYYNDEMVSETLYRIGGFGIKSKYNNFLIIKYTEAIYDDKITKDPNKKKHLASSWCIIDFKGIEKVNFERFANPYIIGNIIYILDNKFYNIERGYCYGQAYQSIHSENYLFLEIKRSNKVMRISKNDGSFEIFE